VRFVLRCERLTRPLYAVQSHADHVAEIHTGGDIRGTRGIGVDVQVITSTERGA
jgi:hypothetical protein